MKIKVFLDAVNNGYARLVSEDNAMAQMDVLLTTHPHTDHIFGLQ